VRTGTPRGYQMYPGHPNQLSTTRQSLFLTDARHTPRRVPAPRKFDIRRGTGTGTAVLGGYHPQNTEAPMRPTQIRLPVVAAGIASLLVASSASIPAAAASQDRHARRAHGAAATHYGNFGGYRPLYGYYTPPRPVRARRG
jgi:hypothetical protein